MAGQPVSIEPWQKALLPQFLDMTVKRLFEIEAARRQLAQGGDVMTSVQIIGSVTHKIAGTAESFGFPVLGQLARRAEGLCLDLARLPPVSRAELLQTRLLPTLDALAGALDAALDGSAASLAQGRP